MKNSYLRRMRAGWIVCGLLLAFMGGCTKKGGQDVILYDSVGNEQEQRSLTFFGFKADALNLTAIESALQGFMAENKEVNIAYEGIKNMPYWTALGRRAETGNLDDVIMVDHDHVVSMGEKGMLADLSGVPGLENFTVQAREQFVNPDGTVYFLPTCISTYNLYINYDLLEAHGQRVPENWEQFQQVCDYFVSQGIVPLVANNYASLPSLITGRGLYDVYQRTDAGEVIRSFNQNPEVLAKELRPGVDMVEDMLRRGWFDAKEVLVTAQTSDDLAIFAQGERPFMISGGWASVRVTAKNPAFTYGVHPFPILEDGSVLAMQVDTCIAVSADSAEQELAKQFVAYLIQPDVMWKYCDSQASYTPLTEEKRIPSEETLAPSTEYLTNGRIVMRADYRLTLPLNTALTDCAAVLLEGGSAGEAMDVLVRELKAE